jgi:hypothetical protein
LYFTRLNRPSRKNTFDIFLLGVAALYDGLKVYSFKCRSCNYESAHHVVGTPDMDQILTDVNNDFAQYKLFLCKKELTFVHANVLDTHFDYRCPSDKSELIEIDDPQNTKCPRCNKDLVVEEIKPLASSDEASD